MNATSSGSICNSKIVKVMQEKRQKLHSDLIHWEGGILKISFNN